MSNSTSEAAVNHNLLKIGNRVLKIGGRVLTRALPDPQDEEVVIGSQTWKKYNLAFDDGEPGISHAVVNYGQGDVVEYYYTWYAAVRVASKIEGWHLPSASEWATLVNYAGGQLHAGTKLKSTYGWSSYLGNGTDDYGFQGLPAGHSNYEGTVLELKLKALFWTSNEYSHSYNTATYYELSDSVAHTSYTKQNQYYSVRLVKDV